MKAFLAIVSMLVLLGVAISWAIWAWEQMPDVPMSGHGYVAMILGIVFTLLVCCGSMSAPMEISINKALYELLRDDFSVAPRGETELKGFGMMPIYALEFEHHT